jgi:hypothetical protein
LDTGDPLRISQKEGSSSQTVRNGNGSQMPKMENMKMGFNAMMNREMSKVEADLLAKGP